jgi:hypothetical protein
LQWWLAATDGSHIASQSHAYAGRRHLIDSIAHRFSKAGQHGGAKG